MTHPATSSDAILSRGITLVEGLIVLLVISVIMVFAVPKISGFFEVPLFIASERMASDIRFAYRLALRRHTPCGVRFEADENRYSVFAVQGGSEIPASDPLTGEDLVVQLGEGEYRSVGLGAVTFPGSRVLFDPRGKPEHGGSVTLTGAGGGRTVTVAPNTGAVRVE